MDLQLEKEFRFDQVRELILKNEQLKCCLEYLRDHTNHYSWIVLKHSDEYYCDLQKDVHNHLIWYKLNLKAKKSSCYFSNQPFVQCVRRKAFFMEWGYIKLHSFSSLKEHLLYLHYPEKDVMATIDWLDSILEADLK